MVWNVHLQTLKEYGIHCGWTCLEHFKEIGHRTFFGSSALNPGIEKKGGRYTIYCNADSVNTEFVFRTVVSAN